MDLIESIKKDKAYIKHKLTVKNWEKQFIAKHSRIPSKFDIKEAPSNIKYAYKKYFQLKSSALETSLSLCDDEDIGNNLELKSFAGRSLSLSVDGLSPTVDTLTTPGDGYSPQSDSLLPALPSNQELEKLLSNDNVVKNRNKSSTSKLSDNIKKKIFENKHFSLRNPRKSLLLKSQSASETILNDINKYGPNGNYAELCDSNNIPVVTEAATSEDLAAINTHDIPIIELSKDIKAYTKVRQLNEGWIKRVTEMHNIELDQSDQANPKNETITETSTYCKEKFGLRKIEITSYKKEKQYDFVENSESEEDIAINALKPALKKRKIDKVFNEKTSQSRHSDIEFRDYIRSEEDNIPQEKMAAQTKSKTKRKNPLKLANNDIEQLPPDITEYLPFGMEEKAHPRYAKITDIVTHSDTSKIVSPNMSSQHKEDLIEKKITNGTLNENFVKINIEKKVFVRGKKNNNYSKYKKKLWKDKKALHAGMEFPEAGKLLCFKCGSGGHMARYCSAHKGDTLLPLDSYDDNDIPSLEDMQNIVSKEKSSTSVEEELSVSLYKSSQIPESFMKLLYNSQDENILKPIVFDTKDSEIMLLQALDKFGLKSFRLGQEQTIKRILSGMSTLLVLSTGGGKSLCYQLPAYIYSQHYKCITLVISPLVSLMEDQVISMPDFLKAGCLHTNQPATQQKKIVQYLKDGEINILLISPEALISGDTSKGFSGIFKSLPPIAFACIDEAHCVSQWSHNFRPSYLMICRVLREKLNVKCILGLTATASKTTINSIVEHINIPDGIKGVIINPTLPENLHLSVSSEADKDKALVSFLTSSHIEKFNSIIVYCIRRDECERVAALLRSCLQEPGKINMEAQNKKRKRMSYLAESYHAGMTAFQRKKIQKYFMDGTLRVIVATIAFGMGINKSDIRCIIHYNAPRSFESYVQEVGRAGRDGQDAYCHLLLGKCNNDKDELLKHIHSNTIDRPTIRKLLQKVFVACSCSSKESDQSSQQRCPGHEVGIPIDSTVEELDVPSENIATLLCYIELHSKKYIKLLNNAYTMCKISSYGGPKKILEAAKNCPPLAMAYLLESKKDPGTVNKSTIEFNVIEVAAAIGWESGITKYQLKNLEWITNNGAPRRSNLKIEYNTLGFRIKAAGDLSSKELDNILDDLHNIVLTQEKAMLYQLEESYRSFRKLGNYSILTKTIPHNEATDISNELKMIIRNYFQRDNSIPTHIDLEERPLNVEHVRSDVRSLIVSYKDCKFTGRSIARIFQGISSPNYPAIVWGKCKFWRSHIKEDFYGIVKIATQQIIDMRMN